MVCKGHKKLRWSAEDDARMRREFPHMRTETLAVAMGRTLNSVRSRAVLLGLQKTPEAMRDIARDRVMPEFVASRFAAGFTPWNKGRVGEYQLSHGAPLGTERERDGYRERKVHMKGPFHLRWRGVHLITWEAHRGAIPDGHVVAFRDGNRANAAIDNLYLLSQADNLARQSAHIHGPDIFRLHQLRGQITRLLNKRAKQK